MALTLGMPSALTAQADSTAQATPTAPAQASPASPSANPAQASPTVAKPAPSTPATGLPTHGTVLFERHATPADTQPDAQPDASPDTQTPGITPDTSAAGTISSSTRRRAAHRGLQRRDAAGTTTTTADPGSAPAQALAGGSGTNPVAAPPCAPTCDPVTGDVTDVERGAPRVLQTKLDLHLNLQTGGTAARAMLLVRNGAQTPMTRLVLQLSSSLQWQSARLVSTGQPAGTALALHQHRVVTDADHTGAATELVLLLPQPLAPGATIGLDLFYGGTLGSSDERLLRLGAPAGRAALSDWDTVGDRFTGLRGFGNVLWTPTAAPVALLAAGDDFGNIVDEQRLRNRQATLGLRLTLETDGPPPGEAFLLGAPRALNAVDLSSASTKQGAPGANVSSSSSSVVSSSSQDGDAPSTAAEDETGDATHLYTAEWPLAPVSESLPALFVTAAPEQQGALWVRVWTGSAADADAVQAAANLARPLLEDWLGARPARPLEVLDLPLPDALPYSADGMLVAPLTAPDPKLLASTLVYPMAQAWLPVQATGTQAAWLQEGLPAFLQMLYLERTAGREAVLAGIRSDARLLASAEAADGTHGDSHLPLADCVDAVCARTRGAAVFNMLRQLVGDTPLKQAIAAWVTSPAAAQPANRVPAPAYSSSASQAPVPTGESARFEQLLQQASGKDLRWFFADWVDRDAGLPDLTIVSVAPRRIERGTVTNTVPSQRRPVGGPIGAEPVAQPGDPTEQESATAASRNRIASQDGSWLIAVEVQNNGDAAAEVPVTVRGGGLQNSLPLRVPAHSRATIRVPFETAPEEVTVNDGTTPESRTMTHRRSINLPDSR